MFEIVIRKIKHSPEEIEKTIRKFEKALEEETGVPAYYGHQRFGTIRPNTHLVGFYLLKGRFREAFEELVCKVYPNENPYIKEIREKLCSCPSRSLLRQVPKRLYYEKTLVSYLLKHPGDYIGAFRCLEKSIRRFFIQAFQAYLFNRSLSLRIKERLPLRRPLEGDYVVLSETPFAMRILKVSSNNKNEIMEAVKKGKASLALNVFGYNTQLAGGPQGDIEKRVLETENISLEDFQVKHFPEARVKGYYRPALMPVENFKPLGIFKEGDFYSLKLSFILRKGFYATVVLREIMKPDNIVVAGF